MEKVKKAFFCQICGTQHTQWQGQCKGCKDWNTIVEEIISKETNAVWKKDITPTRTSPIQINDINVDSIPRFVTGDKELDTVLGGGMVPGSVILLGGEPGIGKSTLLLQLALRIKKKVLYVSGEESQHQIKLRANRIGFKNDKCFSKTKFWKTTNNLKTKREKVQITKSEK